MSELVLALFAIVVICIGVYLVNKVYKKMEIKKENQEEKRVHLEKIKHFEELISDNSERLIECNCGYIQALSQVSVEMFNLEKKLRSQLDPSKFAAANMLNKVSEKIREVFMIPHMNECYSKKTFNIFDLNNPICKLFDSFIIDEKDLCPANFFENRVAHNFYIHVLKLSEHYGSAILGLEVKRSHLRHDLLKLTKELNVKNLKGEW